MGHIYKIVNKYNGKIYYGSAKNVIKRFNRHKNDLRRDKHVNTHLQRAWNKYGEDIFDFEVVEEVSDNMLLIVEQKYLDINYDGYNIGLSASGGDNISNNPNKDKVINNIKKSIIRRYENMSEEERKEVYGRRGKENSNWKGGRKKCVCGKEINKENKTCMSCKDSSKDNNPFYGKRHTEETKKKLSEVNKGRKPPNRIPFIINGVRYESLSDANKELGIHITTIRYRLKSNNPKFSEYKYLNG